MYHSAGCKHPNRLTFIRGYRFEYIEYVVYCRENISDKVFFSTGWGFGTEYRCIVSMLWQVSEIKALHFLKIPYLKILIIETLFFPDGETLLSLCGLVSALVCNPPYLFSEDMKSLEPEIFRWFFCSCSYCLSLFEYWLNPNISKRLEHIIMIFNAV